MQRGLWREEKGNGVWKGVCARWRQRQLHKGEAKVSVWVGRHYRLLCCSLLCGSTQPLSQPAHATPGAQMAVAV